MSLYPNAAKALSRIAEHSARVDKLLDDATTDEDVAFWQHVELMRNDYVRQAFLIDTADRNSWEGVRCMPVSDIRDLVEGG
jgi:hypothetical protein